MPDKQNQRAMSLAQWVISTAIAGVSMALGFATYVRNFVYPRADGERLERQVGTFSERQRATEIAALTQQIEEERRATSSREELMREIDRRCSARSRRPPGLEK